MDLLADLVSGDHHVHSTFSDDAVSSLAENLAAATAAGLSRIRMVDHVRTSTTYVPEFIAAVRALPAVDGLTVQCGVEAKILDAAGTLDLPAGLTFGPDGLDTVLIADHQFPGPDGPWSPRRTIEEMENGFPVSDAVDMLITATIAAMQQVPAAQLAHPLSLLSKIGLDACAVTDEHLHALADAAAATGTWVEFNEKWRCPGPRALRILRDHGVTVVASTDSHRAADVGRYSWVADLVAQVGAGP